MEHGARDGRDAVERGPEGAPLSDGLAMLEAAVETVCAVDWSRHHAEALLDAVGRAEIVARRLESAGAQATAELAALHRVQGRSAGGVAALLGDKLGLARGVVHGRIEAGGRQGTPAGQAAASGEITAEHERIIARAVSGSPGRWAVQPPPDSPSSSRNSRARSLRPNCGRKPRDGSPRCAPSAGRTATSTRSASVRPGSERSARTAPAP